MAHGGLDATARYDKVNHSDYAKSMRDTKLVGSIEDKPKPDGYDEKVRKLKPLARVLIIF